MLKLLLIIVFITHLSEVKGQAGFESDSVTLTRLEHQFLESEFNLDTNAISAMMHKEFIGVSKSGVYNKQQELDAIHSNINARLKQGHIIDSFYLDDITLNIFGNAAVVVFTVVSKGKIKEEVFRDRRTRFYDLWIRENGKWLLSASQGTPLAR